MADGLSRRFHAYRATQDPGVLAALIADFSPLVQQVAALYDQAEPREDLPPVGYVGLITAAARYDPDRGTPFARFARHFIAGEIRRYLRGGESSVGKPRWLIDLDGRIRRAVVDLFRRLRRLPTVAEIAREVNVAEQGVLEILRARDVVQAESPPATSAPSEHHVRRDRIHHHHYVSFRLPIEDRIRVAETIERLSVLRRIVVLLFSMDFTQTEVARRLLIAQRHVSGTANEAIVGLRDILGPPRVLGPPCVTTV